MRLPLVCREKGPAGPVELVDVGHGALCQLVVGSVASSIPYQGQ